MNKKILIPIIILIILVVIAIAIYVINQNSSKPQDTLTTYISLLNDHKYEEMYNLLSTTAKSSITQENFVKRNKNIYEGIDACNIKIEIKETTKEDNITKISYTETMSTAAGNVTIDNTIKMVKEDKTYKMNWSSSQIFPQLRETDKVRISTLKASRGEILDRNGVTLPIPSVRDMYIIGNDLSISSAKGKDIKAEVEKVLGQK